MSAQLENGYTRIANEILEELSKTLLSPYEWQVIMCIFRKTYGFNKKEDRLPISQIATFTGIHKSHVSRTIKKLKNRKIVTRTGNFISFNTDLVEWLPKQVTKRKLPKQVTGVTQTGNKKLPKQADSIDSIKETIQKKVYIPIKDISESHFQEISKKYNVPISFVRSKYDDMLNWHESTGKMKKDWIATLRNFVKKDAIKIRRDQNDKSKVVYITE